MTDKETRHSAEQMSRIAYDLARVQSFDPMSAKRISMAHVALLQAASDLEQRERDQQRIAELERDAGRYRWLRSKPLIWAVLGESYDLPSEHEGCKGLDEAIDTAMEKTK